MSSFYMFYLETNKTPKQIVEMGAVANAAQSSAHANTYTFAINGYAITGGMLSYAVNSESYREENENLWLRSYGFIPTFEMTINHYPNNDPDWTYNGIKKTIAAILKNENGNAVLLKNGDIPVLERIDGRISVTDRKDGWLPDGAEWLKEELNKVGLNYYIQSLDYKLE